MNYEVPGAQQTEKDICSYHVLLKSPSKERVHEIERTIQDILAPWTEEYIWQIEPFHIVIKDDYSLSGTTRFGDCIEDEWLIVWTLIELTRRCSDIFVRITDTDGEFLLIESAMHLPRWLDPDSASNRAWIRSGQFIIIQPSEEDIVARKCPDLSLGDALTHLRRGDKVLHDDTIQQDAFSRIKNYPEQAKKEIHRVKTTLPRVLATVLHRQPALIAPACIELYNRDQSQTAQQSKAPFGLSLDEVHDHVVVSTRFTRTLYAQIRGLKYNVPAWYNTKIVPAGQLLAIETGSKVTCGFDLLLKMNDAAQQALARAREDPSTDSEMSSWSTEVDSDAYLDVDFSELEKVMAGNEGKPSLGEEEQSDETIKKMIQQMQKFINTDSTFEGAEFSDDQDEDVDEGDEFDDDEEVEDGFGDEDMDFMDFLRSSVGDKSALDALRSSREDTTKEGDDGESESGSVGDLREYMASMDAELSTHGLSSTGKVDQSRTDGSKDGKAAANDDHDDDDDEDLKIDFELAKNMLASMKSEGGMGGPAASLLARMGIAVPRDELETNSPEQEQLD